MPNPITNIEAVFSAGGECSFLGVDIPIPSESSTNPMIGVGIDTAVVGVVSMFNGWLMAQSYTIPLENLPNDLWTIAILIIWISTLGIGCSVNRCINRIRRTTVIVFVSKRWTIVVYIRRNPCIPELGRW